VASVAVLAFLSFLIAKPAWGQVKVMQRFPPGGGPGGPPVAEDPNGPTEFSHSLTLAVDPKLNKRLEAAKDLIKEQNWPLVVKLLQGLLDMNKEDVFLEVLSKGLDGKKTVHRVGVRMEANRLIGTLPPKGLEFYKQAFGQQAAEMLKTAKEKGDDRLLTTVAISYLHTDAGAEATELLGTRRMDRGDFFFAARYFTQLIDRQGADKLSPLTLFKARLAFRRTKEKDKEKLVAEQLALKAPDGIRFGERQVSLSELNDIVDQYKDPRQVFQGIDDCLCFMSRPNRNNVGVGSTLFFDSTWRQKSFTPEATTAAVQAINTAIGQLDGRKEPILPECYPIAASAEVSGKKGKVRTQLLIYRSYFGVHAVEMKSGKLIWEAESEWGLERMYKENTKVQAIQQWLAWAQNQVNRPGIVLENSVLGSLSTDGQRVYAVEDLAVPPFVQQFYNGWGGQPQYPWGQKVNDAITHNKLQAFDLGSGKLIWEVGGVGGGDKDKPEKGSELHDTYFLGPPLAMGGKVYALTERREELRLVCLDAAKGNISWIQTLASTKEKMIHDPDRRSQACHLSYGEGVLVCPTNAGAVIGVDLLSHSLLWAYAYRDKSSGAGQPEQPNRFGKGGRFYQPGMPMPVKKWKVSAPVIQDGKVVFTAPDGSSIDCLNLKDGSRLWRSSHIDGDLYMAGVYAGRVVIVGKSRTRALNLHDGTTAWMADTGMPSGRGIASNNVYYLPIKADAKTKEPEVCGINVLTGSMFHTKSRKKEVPGNLLFYDGAVVSQTPTEIVAYPQLKVKLQEIDEAIAKNPDDPIGLTNRGELRLDEGDRAGAVDDLRKALQNKPPAEILAKTKLKLYESLTEHLQHEFNAAEKYLDEYIPMCKVEPVDNTPKAKQDAEEETKKRQANYLCLVATGRENQGKLVEAFDYYQKFGALAAQGQELVSVLDDPAVKAPPTAWARGRVAAMVAKATKEQRAPLEQRIAASWDEVKKTDDTEKIRQFVDMFGPIFQVGREAEMNLAERLLEQNNKSNLLEAEQHLLRLRGQHDDPQLAARAVETLAKLMARHGLLDDAAAYYRILGRDFAKVEVRDGKTGADLLDELATDKRFLPYLDEPSSVNLPEIRKPTDKCCEIRQVNVGQPQPVFGFEPSGELLPFFQRHKIGLNVNFHQVKVIDRKTGQEVWGENLTRTDFPNHMWQFQNNPNAVARFRYPIVGHLVVLPVSYRVYGIDPINHKVLWEKNLRGASPGGDQLRQQWFDPQDGQLVLLYTDGYMQKLGRLDAASPNYVCLLTRDGLTALDPVTGRTLWTRSDVSQRGQLFGDADHVFLVEVGSDGSTGGSRAFRASDGALVKSVKDFSPLYQRRIRTIGRNILLTDSKPEATTLRLYDVLAGKDVWTKDFKAGAIVLKTDEPELAGMIEPDGKLTVVDLRTKKDILRAGIDPNHIKKARSVALLQDNLNFYLAINGEPDANFSGVWSNMQPQTGLRTLPINGYLYALDRRTGKVRWNNDVGPQMLVLEHFRDMPVIMFSSRYQKWNGAGGGRFVVQAAAFRSLDKRTGKLLRDESDIMTNPLFHALNVNLKAGRIDLVGYNMTITHYLANSDAKASDVKGGGQPQGGYGPGSGGGSGVIQPQPVRIRKQVIEKKP
jgi:outer membrane protein assembly factor BamB/tetratricopeptide (TPR) repeat protein